MEHRQPSDTAEEQRTSEEVEEVEDNVTDAAVDFVSLGMLIIDDIEYLPPRPPVRDVLGGAGAYAALGARLFSPAPRLSRSIGWVVDQGSDFPAAMRAQIDGWQTAVVLREDAGRLTTRGWNGYDVGERRAFRYTTPKVRLTAADLPPPLLRARSVHIVSSAGRCRELVADLLTRRRQLKASGARPYIVWEPVPDRCSPDELLDCTNTLPVVDVCSPNHAELAAYMGDPDGGLDPASGRPSAAAVERACEQLLAAMPLQSYAIVVRAAELGCYNLHGGLRPDIDMEALFAGLQQDDEGAIAREEIEVDPGLEIWVPAVFGTSDKDDDDNTPRTSPVVDPTGGGNAFMGAMALALARGHGLEQAAVWGNVAASFAIQQVGVAVLGRDPDGRETWNGERVDDRCTAYETRLRQNGLLRGDRR
ncbi:carbohydrate/purine kinase [Grosmannia clavigera kw1407]|uniref:Carbohydrate/purine kinase n=1 Tax=Grosmannia clavigera (strain kw1407 / UAMH 11150) TaxID=655863 RepID=F0XF32_GROCL|nr:carbohydrate/purine kinase [Grosmannia clavigera kw1407]EFX03733.1 carbohydrate/purine kinase [Grosmannia clavigera kw1407]